MNFHLFCFNLFKAGHPRLQLPKTFFKFEVGDTSGWPPGLFVRVIYQTGAPNCLPPTPESPATSPTLAVSLFCQCLCSQKSNHLLPLGKLRCTISVLIESTHKLIPKLINRKWVNLFRSFQSYELSKFEVGLAWAATCQSSPWATLLCTHWIIDWRELSCTKLRKGDGGTQNTWWNGLDIRKNLTAGCPSCPIETFTQNIFSEGCSPAINFPSNKEKFTRAGLIISILQQAGLSFFE